jgi:hypothetical protein
MKHHNVLAAAFFTLGACSTVHVPRLTFTDVTVNIHRYDTREIVVRMGIQDTNIAALVQTLISNPRYTWEATCVDYVPSYEISGPHFTLNLTGKQVILNYEASPHHWRQLLRGIDDQQADAVRLYLDRIVDNNNAKPVPWGSATTGDHVRLIL